MAAISCCGTRVMSRPSNAMLPDVEPRKPETMLKKVVLPAPFGPITANRLPSGTSRSIALLATSPSKRLVSSVVLRRAISGLLLAAGQRAERRQALRRIDQRRQEDDRIGDVLE